MCGEKWSVLSQVRNQMGMETNSGQEIEPKRVCMGGGLIDVNMMQQWWLTNLHIYTFTHIDQYMNRGVV